MPSKLKRPGLFGQMVLLMLVVLLFCIMLITVFFSSIIDQLIEDTTGQQALTAAELVAENASIIAAFSTEDPAQSIQPIAEELRVRTGAKLLPATIFLWLKLPAHPCSANPPTC